MSEDPTPHEDHTQSSASPDPASAPPERAPARFGLFLALTILIQLVSALVVDPLPIYIATLLALIVAFPLSVFVFKNLRLKTTAAVAEWDAQRKAYKEWVKQELSSR